GGDPARQRIGKRAQPQLDEQVDGYVIAGRRRGLLGGEHRAARHDNAQRAETSLVDRIVGRGEALDQQSTRADRDRVAAVERADDLRVRAREIDGHTAVAYLDRHLDAHGLVERNAVVVEVADRPVRARGNSGQRRARPTLGLRHIYGRRFEDGLAPVSGENLVKRGLAGPAHGDHGLDVLERAALRANVRTDNAHHFFVQLASAQQSHRLEAEAFLSELARADLHAARHRAPDVGPVRLDRHETRQLAVPEHGRGHGDVVEVIAVAGVGIVVDEDVAFAKCVETTILDRRIDRKTEVALEDGQPDALGYHLHIHIEDRAAEVQAFADDVVVRGLDHGEAHPLGGGVERGADDLDGDGIEGHGV